MARPSAAETRDADSLITAATGLISARHSEQARLRAEAKTTLRRLVEWAWTGEVGGLDVNDAEAMAALKGQILTVARLLCQPLLRHCEAWPTADTTDETWAEDLVGLVPGEHDLGKVLLAAAGRWQLMHGRAILPTLLACIAGLDLSRVNDRARKGLLEVEPTDLEITRPGRRPKGAEKRILAASALKWLIEDGHAPKGAAILRPKRTKPR
jgi:hypothetical protein